MATRSRAARIERLLAEELPEGRHSPYATTARTLFAHVVDESLGNREVTRETIDPYLPAGRSFVQRHWSTQSRIASPGERIQLVGRDNIEWSTSGGVFLYRGYYASGTRTYLASIAQRHPVVGNRVTPKQFEAANARLPDLARRAVVELHRLLGEKPRTSWSATRLESRFDAADLTVTEDRLGHRVMQWTIMDLAHQSDEVLLAMVPQAVHNIRNGRRHHDLFQAQVPEAQSILNCIAARSGLPITIGIRPAPTSQEADRHPSVRLVIDGYGPSGRRALVYGQLASANGFDEQEAIMRLNDLLSEQRRRHALFGPTPGSRPQALRMDVPTARLLRDHADGDAVVERCLASGKADFGGGRSIRIRGTDIVGTIPLADGACWHGDELRIVGASLPQSVKIGLVGRDIHDVVDCALLKDAGTVRRVRSDTVRKDVRLRMEVDARMVALGEDPDAGSTLEGDGLWEKKTHAARSRA